ncbi:MAG: 12 protein [Acidimicrobiales bacterium]|nr:12 protein [Acidimicrobiales bacterium]
MTLNGTLEDFSPAGILKVLSADGRTGAVRFGGTQGCTVYLHRGQLYFARNEGTDEALATALVRPGRLTADDWGRAIDASGDRPMVGELLVRDGAIGADLLASVVLSVIYDPLIDLFRDGNGEFDFEPDTVHWLGPFRAFPVDAIIGEVRKRVREVDEWAATIPSLDCWVEAGRTLPGNAAQVTILREDWELVTALSGPRTIGDLANELGRGAYSTARVVHRLESAGLVEVVSTNAEADVVPIRRRDLEANPLVGIEGDVDPLLAMGLPHRSATSPLEEQTAPAEDPLTAHIGDAIADALADADVVVAVPSVPEPALSAVPDLQDVDHNLPSPNPSPSMDHRWDESRRVADGSALHHEDLAPTSLDDPRPTDPNAAWLADLYSQFIDEPEAAAASGKKRRRGEPNPVDVAFKSDEQDTEAKVSTLKRLMGALKKL